MPDSSAANPSWARLLAVEAWGDCVIVTFGGVRSTAGGGGGGAWGGAGSGVVGGDGG